VTPARISLPPGRLRKVSLFKTCGRKAFATIRGSLGGKSCFVRGDRGCGETSFPSLISLLSGFWVHPQGSGGGRGGGGGVTPSRLRSSLRRFLCGRRRSKNHWFRLSRLIADPPVVLPLSAKRMFKMLWQKRASNDQKHSSVQRLKAYVYSATLARCR
jgi:hypothetical protein